MEEACSADLLTETEPDDGLWPCQCRCAAQAAAQAAARAAACTGPHTPVFGRPIPMNLVVLGVSTGGEVAGTLGMVNGQATWKRATRMSAILMRKLTSQTGDAQAQAW